MPFSPEAREYLERTAEKAMKRFKAVRDSAAPYHVRIQNQLELEEKVEATMRLADAAAEAEPIVRAAYIACDIPLDMDMKDAAPLIEERLAKLKIDAQAKQGQ